MTATRGRRVVVRDGEGERTCFLAGQRAVVGDEVCWVEVHGSGGKLVSVAPRRTVLERVNPRGRGQVLAANLGGLLVVTSPEQPPFRPGLVDRYTVAARSAGLSIAVCLNKTDLGVPAVVDRALAWRADLGIPSVRLSARTGEGLDALRAALALWSSDAPWALVGHSGVGKTSIVRALLPDQDVGPVGDLSEYWGTGQHTTTGSRLFDLQGGGAIVDSPGIRTFAPGGLASADVGRFFPGTQGLGCRYRNCRHRPGEDGCVADEAVPTEVLSSYRRLYDEMVRIEERLRPG